MRRGEGKGGKVEKGKEEAKEKSRGKGRGEEGGKRKGEGGRGGGREVQIRSCSFNFLRSFRRPLRSDHTISFSNIQLI